ncbi:condensation domain-containing protein, partial [Flavitalea flava]
AAIWEELLGVDRIGIHDNFFELGGHSIITIQVGSRVRRLGYVLQPRDIFRYQNIGSLSESIVSRSASGDPLYTRVVYSRSRRLLSQTTHWKKVTEQFLPLRVDKTYAGAIGESHIQEYKVRLDDGDTRQLIQDAGRIYHTEISDMVVCALALTLNEWSGDSRIVIGLKSDKWEDIGITTDESLEAEWPEGLYPVLLELTTEGPAADQIRSVKEQLRKVPDKGLGYAVLKYIIRQEELQGDDPWDIVFTYESELKNPAEKIKKISVSSRLRDGKLELSWRFSALHYEKVTIQALAGRCREHLVKLIVHCTGQQAHGPVYTPSDYGLGKELNYAELDRFMETPVEGRLLREQLEGLYRLSGLQEGMLFHSLYDQQAGAYIEQFSCMVRKLDPAAFKLSWESIVAHHSILRSGFFANVFSIPVQAVYRQAAIPMEILDWREMPVSEQEAAIKAYDDSDRRRGFDLSHAPLMRITLMRLGDDRHRMLWTSHHLLADGWSIPILVEELLNVYEQALAGNYEHTEQPDRYEDYIRYIESRDGDLERAYWENYLRGLTTPVLLPFIDAISERNKGGGAFKEEVLQIDTLATARVVAYAQRQRITVNTLMQGIWSYLLYRYTGSR